MTSTLLVLSWAGATPAPLAQGEEPLRDAAAGAIPSAASLLADDVALVCERVRAVMSNTPGTFVESVDGIFYEGDLPPDDAGCLVLVSGSWSDLEGSADPIERLVEILSADGWKEVAESSADGADGSAITLENAGVSCAIRGQWDGSDDTDSTYVPSDVYQVVVRCGRTAAADALEKDE